MKDSTLFPGISIVIPVYNSEDTLQELVLRLESTLQEPGLNMAEKLPYEIILVNDGSEDQSWETISRLSQNNQCVRGINLMRNYGQHNALLCGVRASRFDTVVTIDDDLQHPPEEIPKLLSKLSEGYDVVYGTPIKQKHSLWRNLGSYFTRLALQGTIGIENARKVSAFRALRTQIREAFTGYQSPFVILDVLLAWGTTNFVSIPVHHETRHTGVSNYTFRKLMVHAINMTTGFTVIPLQLASMAGFGFAFFGMLVLFYVIGRYLIQQGSVPGFPFLASIIAIFSGVQLFALGIMGEYLARIHFRIMEKPTYIVRDQIDFGGKEISERGTKTHE
jgi:undecaprenyl-phosphate 4-deoxy-4-formamido-L-arabinose transferase